MHNTGAIASLHCSIKEQRMVYAFEPSAKICLAEGSKQGALSPAFSFEAP